MLKAEAHDTDWITISERPVRCWTRAVNPARAEIDVTFQGNGRLQTEHFGAGQWTQPNLRLHRARVETVPGIAADTGDYNIGDDGPHAECFTGEIDPERMAHKTASPIRSNQIAHLHDFFTRGTGDGCSDTGLVLLEASELAAKFRHGVRARPAALATRLPSGTAE